MWSHNLPLKLEKTTRASSVSEERCLGGEMTSSLRKQMVGRGAQNWGEQQLRKSQRAFSRDVVQDGR